MLNLNVGSKVAVYLNHSKLINEAYNECFTLKEELFDFREKDLSANENEGNEGSKKSVRKRKAKGTMTNSVELSQLQELSAQFLRQLKDKGEFPKTDEQPEMPRYWEDCSNASFPKFHGVNATNAFQETKFGDQYFIIPPHCSFFNHDITTWQQFEPQLTTTYDLIIMDPPWRNKYIRRLKRARQDLAYAMLDNTLLQSMPIAKLVHEKSLVAIWCTNSQQHQTALINDMLPAWNLRLLHKLKWLKLSTAGEPIGRWNGAGNKQPYETLFIACHEKNVTAAVGNDLSSVEMLLSVPSIVHSHKPPLLPFLRKYLPDEPQCLELFARYLQPHFTSIGLEVLKLMDKRLYRS